MEFFEGHFAFELVDGGKMNMFVADVFQQRPPFEAIEKFSDWSNEACEKMKNVMSRKNCSLDWVSLVIDQQGLLVLVQFMKPVILGNAKTAASSILQCLPDEQRRAVEKSLRPLDEFDKERIASWQTVSDVRPRGFKRERDEDEDVPSAKRARTLQVLSEQVDVDDEEAVLNRRKRAVQSLADEDSSSDDDIPPPCLAIANTLSSTTPQEVNIFDPRSLWEHRAKQEATIVVAEVGERPGQLPYIRCHRESRRILFLKKKVCEEAPRALRLLQVVQIAMKLSHNNALPGPGKHGRTNEFLERCGDVLKLLKPDSPTKIDDQSASDQISIRRVLSGGEAVHVPECLALDCTRGDNITTWIEKEKPCAGDVVVFRYCLACDTRQAFARKTRPEFQPSPYGALASMVRSLGNIA